MGTTTGAITSNTQVKPLGTRGVAMFAQATTAAMTIYDGNGSGTLIATIGAGTHTDFGNGVEFKNGLYASITGGTGVIHIG